MKAGHGKKNDDVATPPAFYKYLDDMFHFDYDPCPLHGVDAFTRPWGQRNYVNPPYSNIEPFMKAAVEHNHLDDALSVFLVPVRSNTNYWHRWVYPHASQIWFLKGGIQFVGYNTRFPLALCIVIFGEWKQGIERHSQYVFKRWNININE